MQTMEDQCSPFGWDVCYQEERVEDQLRHSLLYTTMELETTILSAKEKISRRDEEVVHLKDLLTRVIKERDEAKAECERLVLDKFMLQQELQKQHKQEEAVFAPQSHEVESKSSDSNKHFVASASSSDEDIISSPTPFPTMSGDALMNFLGDQKPLPEKGKLLQAVIEAGPLLQTLLLAGPLPQWQHPPPQLKTIEIPPVAISPPTPVLLLQHQDSCINSTSNFSTKRSLVQSDGSTAASDSSPKTKYQKVVLH